jgi:hypothetical protein
MKVHGVVVDGRTWWQMSWIWLYLGLVLALLLSETVKFVDV